MQDVLSLGDVTRIGGCRHQVVLQSGFCVDSDMGPYSKVVLDFLLFGLVHFKIARTALILGRTGRRDQRCVNRGTASERESLGLGVALTSAKVNSAKLKFKPTNRR